MPLTPADPRPGRAVEPRREGVATRDGVRLAWAVHGLHDAPTVLLMPTWSLFPSDVWKAQLGHLSRHYRVLSFDGRGSGRSDRPVGAAAYADEEYTADALAVLDATGTAQAVVASLSCGASWSVRLAAGHPERVLGLFAIAPSCGLAVPQPERERVGFDEPQAQHEGWGLYNRHAWLGGQYEQFLDFFFERMFPEAHSSKQVEDALGWGRSVSPDTLVDTTHGRLGCEGAMCAPLEPLCAAVRCPVTVVHGTDDRIRGQLVGERLAELTGGSLVLLGGAGHAPLLRDPVVVNLLLSEFVDQVSPRPRRTTWTRAASRPRRALLLSSPIGLGHARRDLAVAQELRALRPDLRVDWLTQDPVTRLLHAAGERVHPASASLASESGHIEDECGEHDLNAFAAIRRMDEILVHNFMVFRDVVRAGDYDLVIGDEAWEVDHFLHENPELKTFAFAWMTDFVGWLPMPDGGAREAELTADRNAEMLEQRARFRRIRDASVFVGSPGDVVDLDFGPGLPGIREWTVENYAFPGYVMGVDDPEDPQVLRLELGIADDEQLCVVTVGGSGVGRPLLHRVLEAVPLARRLMPGLRFLVVAGPRIDPTVLPCPDGATVLGWVPDLQRYLAACDVAVVQGGLTTCMELTALRKPFVYVPLQRHFEQNLHVRHRLERYGAGRCLPYGPACDPVLLAQALCEELGRRVDYLPVETDGARRTAALLSELL